MQSSDIIMRITMERLGSSPHERSWPPDQSLDNGTCPDICRATGVEAGWVAMDTLMTHDEAKNAVRPDRLARLNAAIRGKAGEVAVVAVTASTVLDAAPALGHHVRVVPRIDLGFPVVEG